MESRIFSDGNRASAILPMEANSTNTKITGAAEDNAPWRFRHYRFKIDDCMGERIGVQLSR